MPLLTMLVLLESPSSLLLPLPFTIRYYFFIDRSCFTPFFSSTFFFSTHRDSVLLVIRMLLLTTAIPLLFLCAVLMGFKRALIYQRYTLCLFLVALIFSHVYFCVRKTKTVGDLISGFCKSTGLGSKEAECFLILDGEKLARATVIDTLDLEDDDILDTNVKKW